MNIKMKKFPVISESGKEYLVHMENNYYWGGHYDVILYVPYQHRGWFGTKEKLKKIDSGLYKGETWQYNFIDMAKDKVKGYEDWLEASKNKDEMMKKKKEEFENWDGK